MLLTVKIALIHCLSGWSVFILGLPTIHCCKIPLHSLGHTLQHLCVYVCLCKILYIVEEGWKLLQEDMLVPVEYQNMHSASKVRTFWLVFVTKHFRRVKV